MPTIVSYLGKKNENVKKQPDAFQPYALGPTHININVKREQYM